MSARTLVGRVLIPIKTLLAKITLVIEFCHRCGRRQPLVWWSEDELWVQLTGDPTGAGIMCPRCFDREARRQGLLLQWRPRVLERRTV